jgi:hypothetical protein
MHTNITMVKKIVFTGLGLFMVAAPLAASAQATTQSSTSISALIAVYTQLIQLLEQEIALLIAAPGGSTAPAMQPTTPNGNPVVSITNISGLTVTFQYANMYRPVGNASPTTFKVYTAKSGNPVLTQPISNNTPSGMANFTLTATAPDGNYSIVPLAADGAGFASLNSSRSDHSASASFSLSNGSITVTGSNSTQPSASPTTPQQLAATIDQSSLTTGSAIPTITGTFISSTGGPEVVISTQPLSSFVIAHLG